MKSSTRALMLFFVLAMTGMIGGCATDSEYEQNRLTMGVGFEELGRSDNKTVFVYTDSQEYVFLRFIALRYRSQTTDHTKIYLFDTRISKSDCTEPIPENVKDRLIAEYQYNKKAGLDELTLM